MRAASLRRSSIALPWRRAHVVGAALVGTMLLAYCLVLAASMRRADRARSVQASLLQARMACETLPLARARGACVEALRADAAAAAIRP